MNPPPPVVLIKFISQSSNRISLNLVKGETALNDETFRTALSCPELKVQLNDLNGPMTDPEFPTISMIGRFAVAELHEKKESFS
jgi:hypothetical protein